MYGDKKGVFPVINFTCDKQLCDTITVIPVENTEAYITDYEKMKALSLFEGNDAKIMSIFYDIIHRLSSNSLTQSNILFPAIKYPENNYTDPHLTNETLAKNVTLVKYISENYLPKNTKQHQSNILLMSE